MLCDVEKNTNKCVHVYENVQTEHISDSAEVPTIRSVSDLQMLKRKTVLVVSDIWR